MLVVPVNAARAPVRLPEHGSQAFGVREAGDLVIRVARDRGARQDLDDRHELPLAEADARLNAWGTYTLRLRKFVLPPPPPPRPLGETQARFDASDASDTTSPTSSGA